MSSRHLVTGAAGLIGFELARQLLDSGDEVIVADSYLKGGREDLARLAQAYPNRLRIIKTDLARTQKLADLHGSFDTVFHLAAIVGVRYVCEHPYETIAVNLRSTLNVLDHAMHEGCNVFAFASSSENYACGTDAGYVVIPTHERVHVSISDIELPRWSYAASKIAGESAVFGASRENGFSPAILRFHNVYGPRMGLTHVIPELVERCLQRTNPFPLYGSEQTRTFLHVDDAACAIRLVTDAAKKERGGVYNIGHYQETRIKDLAQMIFDETDFHPEVEEKSAPEGSVARRVPDITKIETLGFKPRVTLQEGIREVISAYRDRVKGK